MTDKIILMFQFSQDETTKSYYYYDNREEVVELFLNLYESYLEEDKKNLPKVKIVELSEFLNFFYSIYDFAYLEYDNLKKVYLPYGKDWFTDIIKRYLITKSI